MNPFLIVGALVSLLVAQGTTVLRPLQLALTSSASKPTQQIEFEPVSYQPAPVKKPNATSLTVGASSALISDVSSGTTLFAKDINTPRPMASLTKLMTALVILESHSLDETVTIPEDLPTLGLEDQKIGVVAGEEFKLRELLKALLIYSANDVANSLAVWDAKSIPAFTTKMNQKAKDWGLGESVFKNPNGLDAVGQQSSARDLLTLASLLLHNAKFKETVKMRTGTTYNLDGKAFELTSTNKLLGTSGVIGLKTGFTLEAGQCLITLAERNGHQIITVVLNSPDRFQESKNMVEWAFANHEWK